MLAAQTPCQSSGFRDTGSAPAFQLSVLARSVTPYRIAAPLIRMRNSEARIYERESWLFDTNAACGGDRTVDPFLRTSGICHRGYGSLHTLGVGTDALRGRRDYVFARGRAPRSGPRHHDAEYVHTRHGHFAPTP